MGIDAVHDATELLGVVLEVGLVLFNDQHASFIPIKYKVLVTGVQVLQIVQLHGLLIVAATLLDVGDEMGHGSPQVNHQVRQTHDLHHLLEEFHIGIEVTLAKVAHRFVRGSEHIHALENRTVLDDCMVGLVDVKQILEPFLQEIHFHRERPSRNILVIVLQIRVIVHRLESGFPSVVLGQHPRECGFPASYISCYSDVHNMKVSGFKFQVSGLAAICRQI